MLKAITFSLFKMYQDYIRMMLPAVCRFSPTCSEYAQQAILKYGFFKGTLIGIKRLLRCHPFSHKAGFDPLL